MLASEHGASAVAKTAFDVGIDQRVKIKDAVLMGFQNVFVMTGIFVFPGILGRSFNFPPETVAYLYGMTFVGCGVTTFLMAWLGRMPLVAGPYAGVFTAILTFGHLPGSDLGTALGSLSLASLIWGLFSLPIRGVSPVSLVTGLVRTPAIAGVIVMLVMMQIADLSFPHWLGKPGESTFPFINFGSGLVTAIVLMILTVSKRPMIRRLSLLLSLAAGAAVFEIFHPINFGAVATSPWLVTPKLFPFGLSVNPEFCLVFFIILSAINIQTVTLMSVVGEWANVEMSPARMSKGVFAMAIGSAIAGAIGSFSNLPYPANVAMLRATGVASRYVTMATAAILIVMGFCTKIDYIFVLLPVPVLSAAATVLFGVVFVHGVEMLAKVEWDNRSLAINGFSLMIGFGCLFIEPKTLAALPLTVSLMLRQPIIVGVLSLLVLGAVLPGRARRSKPRDATLPAPADFVSDGAKSQPSAPPSPQHPATII
jgi:xanthine/uracil permease